MAIINKKIWKLYLSYTCSQINNFFQQKEYTVNIIKLNAIKLVVLII